ncbi:MAG: hypothetical protein IH962_01255 [Chloroflexi bacterium]|nr:hypothetical protein [Chloroflexota bacterium]
MRRLGVAVAQTKGHVRWSLSLLCLVVWFGLVACDTSRAVSAGESLASSPALDVLKRSIESGKDLKSFRAQVNMSVTMLGQDVPMFIEMDVAENERIRMTMSMKMPIGDMDIETILSGDDIYTRLP